MSFSEIPVPTDAEVIKQELAQVQARLDSYVTAINGIGANVQWLVDNVQSIFATFANPAVVSQMMGSMLGGMQGAPGPAADPIDGPAES